MSDDSSKNNFREERIEKLLFELQYEIERGMMQREISETMTFRFCVPFSKSIPDGVVLCEFRTRPAPRYALVPEDITQPRLRIIG